MSSHKTRLPSDDGCVVVLPPAFWYLSDASVLAYSPKAWLLIAAFAPDPADNRAPSATQERVSHVRPS